MVVTGIHVNRELLHYKIQSMSRSVIKSGIHNFMCCFETTLLPEWLQYVGNGQLVKVSQVQVTVWRMFIRHWPPTQWGLTWWQLSYSYFSCSALSHVLSKRMARMNFQFSILISHVMMLGTATWWWYWCTVEEPWMVKVKIMMIPQAQRNLPTCPSWAQGSVSWPCPVWSYV